MGVRVRCKVCGRVGVWARRLAYRLPRQVVCIVQGMCDAEGRHQVAELGHFTLNVERARVPPQIARQNAGVQGLQLRHGDGPR